MATSEVSEDDRELSEDVFEIVTAQDGGGSVTVTIPIDAARDLDIDAGDRVVALAEEGDQSITFRNASDYF